MTSVVMDEAAFRSPAGGMEGNQSYDLDERGYASLLCRINRLQVRPDAVRPS